MSEQSGYRYRKHLMMAGLSSLAGLVLGLIYAFYPTPWTMMGFLGLGSLFVFVGIGLFVYTQIRDFKARLRSLKPKRFTKGQVIYHQGDAPDLVYFIREGEVEVLHQDPVKGEIGLGTLGPGDHFGETGVFRQGPRQATVRALSDLETMALHAADFQTLYNYLPRLQERLNREYERRQKVVAQAISTARVGSDELI